MGALAAAGCAWSVRGDTRSYGGKLAWLAGRDCCTALSWVHWAVRVTGGFLVSVMDEMCGPMSLS